VNNQADILKDFHHKAAYTNMKKHTLVIAEDLKILNTTKSASDTLENPGINIDQK
jgi:hypothetical protein